MSLATIGNVLGLSPRSEHVEAIVRGGSVEPGETVVFALDDTLDAGVSDNDIGQTDSGLCNVVQPVTAALAHGIFAVYDPPDGSSTLADDATGRFLIRGIVKAKENAGSVAPGTPLCAANGSKELVDASSVVTAKKIAIALDDTVAGTKTRVLFDGWNGFGTYAAS